MFSKLSGLIVLYSLSISGAYAEGYDSVNRLKTFFTTASERARLDEMRRAGKFEGKVPGTVMAISTEPKKVKLRGVVMREKGDPVVWINEGNTLKSRIIDNDISVNTRRIKSAEKVPVNVDSKRLIMKPGQEWTESGNKVQDSYQTK